MPRIFVWRCPKCGSTKAGPDEARSLVDLTWMQCLACGEAGLCDAWERDEDWGCFVEIPEGATGYPDFVPPLPAGQGSPESVTKERAAPASVTTTPSAAPSPRGAPFGCDRCQGADAGIAWQAGRKRHLQSLIDESHYEIAITTCDCGQHFVKVFTERIDWVDGEDDQTWLLLPVLPAEVLQLQQCPVPELRAMVTRFGEGRRFVVHLYPTGGALSTAWRDSGFWIGPHD